MNRSYVVLVVVGLMLLSAEIVVRRRRRMAVNAHETRVSLVVGTVSYSLAGLSQVVVTAAAFWCASHVSLVHLPIGNPLTWIGYIVVDDFSGYWVHRLQHRVRLLWSAHSVHHSPRDFSMVNAARISPVEAMYQPLSTLWAPLIGFPLGVYAPLAVGSLLFFQLQHTQVVGRLGVLDRFLNTPSNHRVHHGSNSAYLDRNFGGYTMIWDRLFGTYAPEVEPVVYGVTDPLPNDGVVATALGGYPRLVREAASSGSWRRALRLALDRPVGHPAHATP